MAKELVISAEEVKKVLPFRGSVTGFNLEVERGSIFALSAPVVPERRHLFDVC